MQEDLQSALEDGNRAIAEATPVEWQVMANVLNADIACEEGGIRVGIIRRKAYAGKITPYSS